MMVEHEGLVALGRDVQAASGGPDAAQRTRQRDAVRGLTHAPAPSRHRPLGLGLGLGLAAIAAAVVAVVLLRPAAKQRVPGTISRGVPAAALAAAPQRGKARVDEHPAQRSDGSAGTTAPDVIVLEEGSLAINAGQARRIEAGPYVVEVDDKSACSVAWDPEEQRFDLDISEGVVVLHTLSSHHTVTAGDHIRATPRGVVITTESVRASPTDVSAAPTPQWKQLARRGRYREAMAAVEAQGFLKKLDGLSRSDLKLLSDVTRLGGAPAKSVSALNSLRSRFPRSPEARRAAFYLGRQAERDGADSNAIKWYREYLGTRQGGSLAREVRGRLFTALARNGQSAQARVVAREYLEHHPTGPHAAAAARLTNPKGH